MIVVPVPFAVALAVVREVGRWLAAGELLPVDVAVAMDLQLQPFGERIDDGHTDTVQASGDLVALAAELSAGMEFRQDDGGGRQSLLGHDVHRDPGAVVGDGHGVVGVERDFDAVGAPCKRLVDRVVHDLVDEMVETARTRRADVHAGPEPDRLESLEDRDVLCGVSCLSQRKKPC